ncbi:MAG: 4-fold beta flower protein [Bacteroidota bacterium]
MIAEWLYDKNGDAKIYLDEDKFINHKEEVVATLEGIEVLSPTGEMIALFKKGVLYDSDNRPVAFIENARGYIPGLSDIFGDPGNAEYLDQEDEMTGEDEASGRSGTQNGGANIPGESGVPTNPVEGGWSDVTLEDLFGTEL